METSDIAAAALKKDGIGVCLCSKQTRNGRSRPKCPKCHGTGKIKVCEKCEGSGWNRESQQKCSKCDGQGVQ